MIKISIGMWGLQEFFEKLIFQNYLIFLLIIALIFIMYSYFQKWPKIIIVKVVGNNDKLVPLGGQIDVFINGKKQEVINNFRDTGKKSNNWLVKIINSIKEKYYNIKNWVKRTKQNSGEEYIFLEKFWKGFFGEIIDISIVINCNDKIKILKSEQRRTERYNIFEFRLTENECEELKKNNNIC